jgi:3-polyprenyl-4-hydroxybenzoate decarboxylase
VNKREAPPRGYADLHEHLERLDAAGLLYRIDAPVNKDTELHPLVRWQFRGGIPEKERKAFLFTNVVDSAGRRYDIPVAVGVIAATGDLDLHVRIGEVDADDVDLLRHGRGAVFEFIGDRGIRPRRHLRARNADE